MKAEKRYEALGIIVELQVRGEGYNPDLPQSTVAIGHDAVAALPLDDALDLLMGQVRPVAAELIAAIHRAQGRGHTDAPLQAWEVNEPTVPETDEPVPFFPVSDTARRCPWCNAPVNDTDLVEHLSGCAMSPLRGGSDASEGRGVVHDAE